MNSDQSNFENCVSLWDQELVIPLLTNLKIAPGTAEHNKLSNAPSSSYTHDHNPSSIPLYQPSFPSSPMVFLCDMCDVSFKTSKEFDAHFYHPLHCVNLRRCLQGLPMVSKQQFLDGSWRDAEKGLHCNNTSGAEEEEEKDRSDGGLRCNNTSGAEEEEEEDRSDGGLCCNNTSGAEEEEEMDRSDGEVVTVGRKPRIFFINSDKEVLSIYRSVLQHKKTEFSSELELIHHATAAPQNLYWVVILCGGGHFAAGVFKGPEIIAHKTFHSYTVRAKQGRTQSSRDNKSATSHPRSAGASLRRYNEQAHNQHVQELLEEWKEHLANCDLIFCRCPKSNGQLLFGGPTPLLSKQDYRLRVIPFPTKKPTFTEVRKVHRNLSQICIHGSLEDILEDRKKPSKKFVSPSKNLAKKLEKSPPRKLTKGELADLDTHLQVLKGASSSSCSDEDVVDDLNKPMTFETMSIASFHPYDSSLSEANGKRIKSRRKKSECKTSPPKIIPVMANESKGSSPEMKKIENFVYSACRMGNLYQLEAVHKFYEARDLTKVSDAIPSDVIEAILGADDSFELLNIKFGMLEKSLLHVAAENGHRDIMWWLLDEGCDPRVTNKRNETPYMTTKLKDARNHFRRYVAANPDRYDYEKANIPGPLTKEQEKERKHKLSEKKKQQKINKLHKEMEARKKEEEKEAEEEEKETFLKLSDREKRALAAERRILASQALKAEGPPSPPRCFQCAKDIGKMVPFEYFDFKFCSTACVRDHRSKGKA